MQRQQRVAQISSFYHMTEPVETVGMLRQPVDMAGRTQPGSGMYLPYVASTMMCRRSANSHHVIALQVINNLIDLAMMHAATQRMLAIDTGNVDYCCGQNSLALNTEYWHAYGEFRLQNVNKKLDDRAHTLCMPLLGLLTQLSVSMGQKNANTCKITENPGRAEVNGTHLHVLLVLGGVSNSCFQVIQIRDLVHEACHELSDLHQPCIRTLLLWRCKFWTCLLVC